MTRFEMIKYHGQRYPEDIPLRIEEIASHFDVKEIKGDLEFSLHTEYSYDKRKFDNLIVIQFPEVVSAQKDGVPQLWKSEKWALQFAQYLLSLLNGKNAAKVIEIHPPFNDYTDMNSFIKIYSIFEQEIKKYYPDVCILIENRCGSVYRGGKFIISKTEDLFRLTDLIARENLELKIAYDIPQIYTAHNVKRNEQYIELLNQAKEIREYIGGVHLWGKKKAESGRRVSHCGDLNTYFEDSQLKHEFLCAFKECFDDDVIRKMVLEVNSGNNDLMSIISDLKSVGVKFV